MAGTLVNGAKTQILNYKLANPPFDTLVMGLFNGVVVITPATVIGDLTEVTGTGYARQPVTGWSGAILLGDNHAYAQAGVVTFLNSGGSDWARADGWFWYDTTAARLVAAGLFSLPFTLGAGQSWPFAPFDELTGE